MCMCVYKSLFVVLAFSILSFSKTCNEWQIKIVQKVCNYKFVILIDFALPKIRSHAVVHSPGCLVGALCGSVCQ